MKLELSDLPLLARNKYFLRSRDLQFYGLPPKVYRRYFPSKHELVTALLASNGFTSGEDTTAEGTEEFRARLKEIGIDPCKCAIGPLLQHRHLDTPYNS